MIRLTRRVIRFFGWLLTPLVAWAASFFGGWVGALTARQIESPKWALYSMVIGAGIGALGGAILWAVAIRWSARRGPGAIRMGPVQVAVKPPLKTPEISADGESSVGTSRESEDTAPTVEDGGDVVVKIRPRAFLRWIRGKR